MSGAVSLCCFFDSVFLSSVVWVLLKPLLIYLPVILRWWFFWVERLNRSHYLLHLTSSHCEQSMSRDH